MRAFLNKCVASLKQQRRVDRALRYNPWVYPRVKRLIEHNDPGTHRVSAQLLQRALRWARQTAYGRAFGSRLEDWPVLEKTALRDRPGDFHRRGVLAVPAATGGTSGVPVPLVRSPGSVAAEQAFLDSLVAPMSFRSARVAVLRGDNVKDPSDRTPPFGARLHGGRRLVLSSGHLSSDTIAWFAEALVQFAPDILWIYPSAAELLVHLLGAAHLEVHVPTVLSGSERLVDSSRQAIQAALGAQVVDYYGQAERVCFAKSVTAGEYWFQPLYGAVELWPVEDEAETSHLAVAEVIGTGYWNSAMPLVRLQTGDRILYERGGPDLAELCRGTAPFRGILGRTTDYVVSARGERLCSLNQLPREIQNLVQLQVVQETTALVRLLVVPGPGFSDLDRQQLISAARLKLPDDIEVVVETTERLERTSQGKTPFLIRRVAG